MDFAGRWHQQGNKGEDDAEGEKDDGSPFFEFRFHKFEVKIGSTLRLDAQ